MSKKVAAQFLARIESDASLRNQIMTLNANSGFDALLDFAAYQGYFFSLEDLAAASKEKYEQSHKLAEYDELPRAA